MKTKNKTKRKPNKKVKEVVKKIEEILYTSYGDKVEIPNGGFR